MLQELCALELSQDAHSVVQGLYLRKGKFDMVGLYKNSGNLPRAQAAAEPVKADDQENTRAGGSSEAAIAGKSEDYLGQEVSTTPNYQPGEIVIGLECCYGTFAYSYARLPDNNATGNSQRLGCHNPVERPEERHYCPRCGGNYCSLHADPTDHDCANIIH